LCFVVGVVPELGTTRSRRGAPAPLSGTEALVLQNPTRALAALVLDAGITTVEAKKMLGL
jgi:hypothetical protein